MKLKYVIQASPLVAQTWSVAGFPLSSVPSAYVIDCVLDESAKKVLEFTVSKTVPKQESSQRSDSTRNFELPVSHITLSSYSGVPRKILAL